MSAGLQVLNGNHRNNILVDCRSAMKNGICVLNTVIDCSVGDVCGSLFLRLR